VCVFVCVCVCEREREEEGWQKLTEMILQVFPNIGVLDLDFHTSCAQNVGVSNPRQLKDLRRLDGTCGDDDFPLNGNNMCCPAVCELDTLRSPTARLGLAEDNFQCDRFRQHSEVWSMRAWEVISVVGVGPRLGFLIDRAQICPDAHIRATDVGLVRGGAEVV
jgi:hypothetical protein